MQLSGSTASRTRAARTAPNRKPPHRQSSAREGTLPSEAKALQAPGGWFVARIDVGFDAVELELREAEFEERQQRFVHVPVAPGEVGQPVAYLGAPALPIDLEERAVPEEPPILPALDAEANVLPRRHGLQVAFDKRVRRVHG